MKKFIPKIPYINRELSWLEFNQRILMQVRDKKLPLLERIKFLAIMSSNFDEFFMVRVGGLQALAEQKVYSTDPSGMTPQKQLEAISEKTMYLVKEQYDIFKKELAPELNKNGIIYIKTGYLDDDFLNRIYPVFEKEVFPILSPVSLTKRFNLSFFLNGMLYILVRLKNKNSKKDKFAVISLPKTLKRIVVIEQNHEFQFMLLEDITSLFLKDFFQGEEILETTAFRVTRNADLEVREDLAGDLLSQMEAILDARKKSICIRLEVAAKISDSSLKFLQGILEVPEMFVYRIEGPLDFTAWMNISNIEGFENLKMPDWRPVLSPLIEHHQSMFQILSTKDVLLHHPFESFDPFIRLLEEAATDPQVLAIKQILYRTSCKSPIVSALIKAAESGKYVTAVVELKARFDEERNIEWAKALEEAGVQIIYGVKGLKTHAKICLIIRKEKQGLKRYMHFGTGNYNEITAKVYSDISFMTSDNDFGEDASCFFNTVTGYSQPHQFKQIYMAPLGLRKKILELIEEEIEWKKQGKKAFIKAKMNSLSDPEIIRALYSASKAGVRIELNIRGICCLQSGISRLSENITITSIIDRYLEHSRILHFHSGGRDNLFISTADWMTRNLDKRVELLIPISDFYSKKRLMEILDTCLKDNTNSWILSVKNRYDKKTAQKPLLRSQEYFYKKAVERLSKEKEKQRTIFEPHKPIRDRY